MQKLDLIKNIRQINSKIPNKAELDEVVRAFAELVDQASGGKVKMFGEEQVPGSAQCWSSQDIWFVYDVFLQAVIREEKVKIQVGSVKCGRFNNENLFSQLNIAAINLESPLNVALAYLIRESD